jgi:hypothetical protein
MSDKKYPAVNATNAKKIIDHQRLGDEFAIQDYIDFRDCTAAYSEEPIKELSKTLTQLKKKFPKEIELRSPIGGEFEAEACSLVHEQFRSLPSEALDDPDFWKYLCVAYFSELVEWRHGGNGRLANLANYGISAERRNLLLRMYYRADIVYEEGVKDPYALAKQGDEDLWKSHFGAVKVGNCPAVVKAFLKCVFPANKKPLLKTNQVRELAKNLTRLRSNVILELYDEQKAQQLIKREVERLVVSVK